MLALFSDVYGELHRAVGRSRTILKLLRDDAFRLELDLVELSGFPIAIPASYWKDKGVDDLNQLRNIKNTRIGPYRVKLATILPFLTSDFQLIEEAVRKRSADELGGVSMINPQYWELESGIRNAEMWAKTTEKADELRNFILLNANNYYRPKIKIAEFDNLLVRLVSNRKKKTGPMPQGSPDQFWYDLINQLNIKSIGSTQLSVITGLSNYITTNVIKGQEDSPLFTKNFIKTRVEKVWAAGSLTDKKLPK